MTFTDKIGRPWQAALWRKKYSGHTSLMGCTPVPEGTACSLLEMPSRTETMGLEKLMVEFAHLTQLSYKGSLLAWQEFLDLPKKMLPKVFQKSELKFSPEKTLKYKIGKISNQFRPGKEVEGESTLQVFVGLDLENPFEQEIHEVALKTKEEKGKVSYYSASILYRPLEDMTKEQKEKWKNFKEKKYPYNNEVFVNKESKIVAIPFTVDGRSIASNSDKGQLVICDGEVAATDETMTKSCQEFMKGLKFD